MKPLTIIITLTLLVNALDCNNKLKPEQNQTITKVVVLDTVRKTIEIYEDSIPTNIFDIEVYFFDVSALKNISPTYPGRPTYTGSIYIVDFKNKTLKGPYGASSTFPNSKEKNSIETHYNTVLDGSYIFNNRSGHKKGTRRGLNLVLETGLTGWQGRYNLGFDKNGDTIVMKDVNIHGGFSNKGNYNSRGSYGCLTIQPKDTIRFFNQFGMQNTTTGKLEGGLYIFRSDNDSIKKQILAQIKSELQ